MAMNILAIGEPLVELSRHPSAGDLWQQGLGGDTLNTAIYLARLMGPRAHVAYVTRLGDDALSDGILATIAAEGIATHRITRVPGGLPGLYLIKTGPGGERRFHYWRSEAPARGLYGHDGIPEESLDGAAVVYLSGITLAVIAPEARTRLIGEMARAASAGAMVAYDPNHRTRLWPDEATAREVNEAAFRAATLVLPSIEDLGLLGLADPSDASAALERLAAMTDAEVILKTGGGPVLRASGKLRESHALAGTAGAVDTTGAGDSFNAGYIAARADGLGPGDAIAAAHALASRVVTRRGAVIPVADMP